MENISQLVIVCRDFPINWKQFSNPIYVGVESGTLALLRNNLLISFVSGDFDSVSEKEFKKIEFAAQENNFKVIKANSQKDYLDAELAIIEAISAKLSFQQIVLLTDGPRWDMILAQVNLLRKYVQYQPILISQENYLFTLLEKTKFTFSLEQLKYRYISFFSLNDSEVIYNFVGCKYYSGIDVTINNKDVLAISNEFDLQENQNPTIEIKKGYCLISLSEKQK